MSRLVYALSVLALVAVALVLYSRGGLAASPFGGAAPTSTPTAPKTSITPVAPITSAGSPTDPVPFVWAFPRQQSDGTYRLKVQGGNLHAIADEVRLVGRNGQVVSTAPATILGESAQGLCGAQYRGMVQADLAVPSDAAKSFERDWPSDYKVEARVGGTWRPVTLTAGGC